MTQSTETQTVVGGQLVPIVAIDDPEMSDCYDALLAAARAGVG